MPKYFIEFPMECVFQYTLLLKKAAEYKRIYRFTIILNYAVFYSTAFERRT